MDFFKEKRINYSPVAVSHTPYVFYSDFQIDSEIRSIIRNKGIPQDDCQ